MHAHTHIHAYFNPFFIVSKLLYLFSVTDRTNWFLTCYSLVPWIVGGKIQTLLLTPHSVFLYNRGTDFILPLSRTAFHLFFFLFTWNFHLNFEIPFMATLSFCATISLRIMKYWACWLLFFDKVTKNVCIWGT